MKIITMFLKKNLQPILWIYPFKRDTREEVMTSTTNLHRKGSRRPCFDDEFEFAIKSLGIQSIINN